MAPPLDYAPTDPSSPLLRWRHSVGLSQERAARLADVSLQTWRSWERLVTTGPPLDVVRTLEALHPGLVALLLPGAERTGGGP